MKCFILVYYKKNTELVPHIEAVATDVLYYFEINRKFFFVL